MRFTGTLAICIIIRIVYSASSAVAIDSSNAPRTSGTNAPGTNTSLSGTITVPESFMSDLNRYGPATSVLSLFKKKLEVSSVVWYDRVGPLDKLQELQTPGDTLFENGTLRGRRAAERWGIWAIRETAVDSTQVEYWGEQFGETVEEYADRIIGHVPVVRNVVRFIMGSARGSLGNVAEEGVDATSAVHTERETTFFENLKNSASFEYGARPWSMSPYYYFGIRGGHYSGQPLIETRFKLAYDTLATKEKFSVLARTPLTYRLWLVAGAEVSPSRIGSETSSMLKSERASPIESQLESRRQDWYSAVTRLDYALSKQTWLSVGVVPTTDPPRFFVAFMCPIGK